MRVLIVFLGYSFLLLLPRAYGESTAAIPSKFIYCTVCHGSQLGGNTATKAPRLSGLPQWYLARQLTAFNQQQRGVHKDDIAGHEMRAAAENISEKDIANAAKFASDTQSSAPKPTQEWQDKLTVQNGENKAKTEVSTPVKVTANVNDGKKYFLTYCASCHGKQGQGNRQLSAPPLTPLNDWYIAQQLANFMRGVRGSDPDNIPAQQMKAAVASLNTKQQVIDIVTYINQLR